MAGSPRAAPHDTINKPLQHTRRHPVTAAAAERAAAAFGNNSEAAAAAVCLLRQPKLRQVFEHVFECTTASGNNQWMRGKLLQALGFSSRWQPAPKQQDEQLQPQTAGIPALVDSSEDSAQTLGRAGTWPPTPRSKRAAPVPGNSPSPKRRAASQAGSPSRAAAAAAPAAAAPASAAPGSVASDAVAGSSSEGQQQQRTLTPTWQQAAAPFDTMAAGSLTAQDTLLWQAPSLQQLLSLQHSTGSSGSADAAMQAALRVLGWGGLAGTAGLAVAPSFDPAAYQLLALDGTDLAFVWQAQLEAQQHPAWRDQMAAYPPPPLSFWAQQVAGGAAPDQAQQLAHTTQQQAQLAQQQQAQLQQAQLAQQQQAQQRFAVGLPTAAAVDQLPVGAPLAGFAFTPAPLSHPPPLPQHWHADHRTVGLSTAAGPPAAPHSVSFSAPGSLAQRSPFVPRAATLPLAAAGAATAPAPTSMPLFPPGVPAVVPQPPAAATAGMSQDARASLSLSEDTPLNDDLLCMYLSWNDASLHL